MRPRGSDDLSTAAALAPDSRLSQLMQERKELEDRLRNLTGLPGQQGTDAHRNARFHVPSFAERQAEYREWEANRMQSLRRQAAAARQARAPTNPLRSGVAAARNPVEQLRSGLQHTSRSNLNRFIERPRDAANTLDEMGRPLRQIGAQLQDQNRQLDEMDRKLAAEGVSEAERQEIRKAVKGDKLDKAGKMMDKANKAISAPKKAVDKVEQGWLRREQQIAGPMDRFSNYADQSERRLSTETGGSGNLFQRMQANRMNALRRRREQKMQDHKDENRRARARDSASARRKEET